MTEDPLHDDERLAALAGLFPSGPFSRDVLDELAPQGWDTCSLKAVFHPSIDQVYEEAVRMHRNIESFRGDDSTAEPSPPPTRDEIAADHRDEPVEPLREAGELLARCLWDVVSDNHEVISPDGSELDFGSFRASGAVIAEWCNQHTPKLRLAQETVRYYDYMDFYMGTIWVASRADLTPVYEFIFRRLHQSAFDWRYHFPRLMLVDMRPLIESLKEDKKPEWEDYSPEAALEKEREQEQHDREVAEACERLDAAHEDAVEEARRRPPPDTVRAYRSVYSRLPEGWPP
ncbi:MAG: hypothetical protein C4547_06435 [Phycisphaerales bacterium]|nr:MAG: hypothetical protein C4547_06435 [Phycisphaerales bacterium]